MDSATLSLMEWVDLVDQGKRFSVHVTKRLAACCQAAWLYVRAGPRFGVMASNTQV